MIAIENTLVSEEVIEEKFVCDLTRCKGACCVLGDAGAPLEEEELEQLEQVYPLIKDSLTVEGRNAIEQYGLYHKDTDDEWVTPLVNGDKECAYTVFENGIAACGIEKQFMDGKISFRKPVSCHLYPVRISKYRNYDAVNYHRWEVCSPACKLGKQLKVPVYIFLKDALIRKYGEDWYNQLSDTARLINEK